MAARPYDMRALGLLMREAEQRGMAEAWPPLDEQVARLSYTPEEIDKALHLLVTPDGLTLGGMVAVSDLDGRHVGQLVLADMIEIGDDGCWTLTTKGQAISNLLDAYAEPTRLWRSLRTARSERGVASCDGDAP